MIVDPEGNDVMLGLHVPRHVLAGPQTMTDVAEHPGSSWLLPVTGQQMPTLNVQAASVAKDTVTLVLPHGSKSLETDQAELAFILKGKKNNLLPTLHLTKQLNILYASLLMFPYKDQKLKTNKGSYP